MQRMKDSTFNQTPERELGREAFFSLGHFSSVVWIACCATLVLIPLSSIAIIASPWGFAFQAEPMLYWTLIYIAAIIVSSVWTACQSNREPGRIRVLMICLAVSLSVYTFVLSLPAIR